MILHIPDELDMPLRYLAEFAAQHGCWLRAEFNPDRDRIEYALVQRSGTKAELEEYWKQRTAEPIGGSK